MKKWNNFKWFAFGVIACLIVSIASTPAFASSLTKSAQLVYNDIKISLNGKTITPTDASGNAVEPFTINGTTYLPVRAISDALGLNVNWNSSTHTVELSNSLATDIAFPASGITNYPNTDVPTYTSITGRALKEETGGAYVYNYNKGECIDYQFYLIQHGYKEAKRSTENKIVSISYYNGKSFVSVGYATQYNEIWIVVR